MDLNTLAAAVIEQLTRIANAAEKSVGAAPKAAAAATTTAPAGETAAAKKKREAEEKKAADAAAAAAAAPKADRPAVNKALVSVKDTISKDAAQAIYKQFGYEAMSKIEDKDFDKVLALATQELEDFAAKTGKYAEDDAPLDEQAGDDDL